MSQSRGTKRKQQEETEVGTTDQRPRRNDGDNPRKSETIASLHSQVEELKAKLQKLEKSKMCSKVVLGEENCVSMTAIDVFVLSGLSFFHPDELFPAIAQTSREFNIRAMKALNEYCKRRHPGLVAALPDKDFVSYRRYKRFVMDGEESRDSGTRWKDISESDIGADGDIDVIFEVSRGKNILGFAVASLDGDSRMLRCGSSIANFSIMTPLADLTDAFWSSGTTFHVRLAMRRRTTGQIVTILSTSEPGGVAEGGRELELSYAECADFPETPEYSDDEDSDDPRGLSFQLSCFWRAKEVPAGATEIEIGSFEEDDERMTPQHFALMIFASNDSTSTDEIIRCMQGLRWA